MRFSRAGDRDQRGSLRRHILLKRNGASDQQILTLYGLLLMGDKSKDVNLETGDVLYFPVVGPQVAIMGQRECAGDFFNCGGTEHGEALSLAGGISATAADLIAGD